MADRISGADLYVTHEKMNSYLTWLLGGLASMVVTTVGATWFLNSEITSHHAILNEKITDVRQDVAVIKVEVSQLSKTAVSETQDISQAQYLFVKLPAESDAGLHDQRVRDVLKARGILDVTP